MRAPSLSLAAAAVLITSASLVAPVQRSVHAAGGTLLRYHWVAGRQFVESETDTTTTSLKVTPAKLGLDSTSVEIDRYTTTTTVTKVFADGSGLVRLTYSKVSITKDGKTTQYPLTGYALQMRVSTTGTVIRKQTIGNAAHLAGLPNSITDPVPTPYPQAPVVVGSTWTQTQNQAGLGKLTYHLQVVALGSIGGRPALTMHVGTKAPLRFSSSGLLTAGEIAVSATGTIFIDTGAAAVPITTPLSFHATMSGTIQGIKVTGTLTLTGTETVTPIS